MQQRSYLVVLTFKNLIDARQQIGPTFFYAHRKVVGEGYYSVAFWCHRRELQFDSRAFGVVPSKRAPNDCGVDLSLDDIGDDLSADFVERFIANDVCKEAPSAECLRRRCIFVVEYLHSYLHFFKTRVIERREVEVTVRAGDEYIAGANIGICGQ